MMPGKGHFEGMCQVKADLHMHSTFSDGTLPPARLCRKASELGLRYIALCDHDSMAGLPAMEAAVAEENERLAEGNREAREPLTLLPCIELSTGTDGRVHVLGYGAHPQATELMETLNGMCRQRQARFAQMLQKLAALGIDLPKDRLPQPAHMAPGRAHIARALIQQGVVHTMKQAFERYLGDGKPAFVPCKYLETAATIEMLRRAGILPVLAHPCRLSLDMPARMALLDAWQRTGLMGVEVFHPSASRRDIHVLETFARARGLLITGGSDYHGDMGVHAQMGRLPSGWKWWRQDTEKLLEAMESLQKPEPKGIKE